MPLEVRGSDSLKPVPLCRTSIEAAASFSVDHKYYTVTVYILTVTDSPISVVDIVKSDTVWMSQHTIRPVGSTAGDLDGH